MPEYPVEQCSNILALPDYSEHIVDHLHMNAGQQTNDGRLAASPVSKLRLRAQGRGITGNPRAARDLQIGDQFGVTSGAAQGRFNRHVRLSRKRIGVDGQPAR